MVDVSQLRTVELFAGLSDSQLAWLATQGNQRELADGTVLFEDGEVGNCFYVLLSGELLITKVINSEERVMSRHMARPAGQAADGKPSAANQYTGELPLLAGGGYVARGTAVGRTRVIVYDKPTFFAILANCPQVCEVLLPVLGWRIRTYERLAGRSALLEGLARIAAGLLHELNNPAAAAVRSASELAAVLTCLSQWAVRWGALATPADHAAIARWTVRDHWGDDTGIANIANVDADADAAGEIASMLADHGLPAPAELASILAECGVDPDELRALDIGPEAYEAGLSFLAYSLQARELAAEAAAASRRIEALAERARAYANPGRAPRQDVNLAQGLDATVAVHAERLAGIAVLRDYADLPSASGYPTELNQVWGSLIDNAADAMNGAGELRLRTFREGSSAVVEIGDDGPGIAPGNFPQLFHPFFTTKDIGRGTGLGLYLSRDIVVHRHNGSIDVTSVPGDTRFTVRLPLMRQS
jgi:signal transduction histidine kinase